MMVGTFSANDAINLETLPQPTDDDDLAVPTTSSISLLQSCLRYGACSQHYYKLL